MLASLYRGVSRSKLWRGQSRSAAKICLSLTYYCTNCYEYYMCD